MTAQAFVCNFEISCVAQIFEEPVSPDEHISILCNQILRRQALDKYDTKAFLGWTPFLILVFSKHTKLALLAISLLLLLQMNWK